MREIREKAAAVCTVAAFFILMIPAGLLFFIISLLEPLLCKLAVWIYEKREKN